MPRTEAASTPPSSSSESAASRIFSSVEARRGPGRTFRGGGTRHHPSLTGDLDNVQCLYTVQTHIRRSASTPTSSRPSGPSQRIALRLRHQTQPGVLMERFARLVMHHRRIVSAFWLLLFLGGLFSAGQLNGRLSLDFSLPGQPGDNAEQELIDTYGVRTLDSYTAVVTVPAGTTVRQSRRAV